MACCRAGSRCLSGMQCMGAGSCPGPQPSAAPCPKLQAAPGCPVLGGSSVVGVSLWLITLQPGLCSQPCTRGFHPQSHLCPGTVHGHHFCLAHPLPSHHCVSLSPANPLSLLLASPEQFLPCHLQRAPQGARHKCTHGVSGGSGRCHRGSRGDNEGERSDMCSMGLKRVSWLTAMRCCLS